MKIEDFKRKSNDDVFSLINHELPCSAQIPLLHFKNLDETGIVKHCFTTRFGGASEGIFESLNLSFTRGDSEEAVFENYKRVAYALDAVPEDIVTSDQTHTTNVIRVGKDDMGNGITKPRSYTDVDGLVTDEPGVVLATFYADCVPLYFVDTVHRAIGLSHSGWKGTVNRMGQKTLDVMKNEFGTNPRDVIAAIGPSICQACYEVSEDVAIKFIDEFAIEKDPNASRILISKGHGKYQLDLWKANSIVLTDAGILSKNLSVTNICTCCNPNLLFSHRASQGKRGNLGAFLALL